MLEPPAVLNILNVNVMNLRMGIEKRLMIMRGLIIGKM